MEVVLSPGRFGDETPGAPFHREEIREWSHVDRLTGMLERARVETGRWQTSNTDAAKSYGKVIDSRERNSADGSVVQKARRQVEIFQSQGGGRSVQVVRASQWSSSRVTDSTASIGCAPILPIFDKQKQLPQIADEEAKEANNLLIAARPAVETNIDRKSREESISERLSALLGSFPYPVSSSTVPLRRIDSKYSSRAPIISATMNKRSNSNEDLAIFARDRTTAHANSKDRIERLASDVNRSMMRFGAMNVAKTRGDNETTMSGRAISREESKACNKTSRSAIQLLPTSKSNRTVVNLMSDSRTPRNRDILDDQRPNLNWISRETRNDDSRISLLPGNNYQKIPKRVGFCKTEIHFVADSGKVNIVETDEKPPPTNKFRRKKRLGSANKIVAPSRVADAIPYEQTTRINDDHSAIDSICTPIRHDHDHVHENARNEHQRGHTTTVKLGTESTRDQEPEGQYCKKKEDVEVPRRVAQEALCQGILLRLENRIYDRLETYTTDVQSIKDTSIPRILQRNEDNPRTNIQQAIALKSARLVMNLTRGPESSKIVIVEPTSVPRIHEIDEDRNETLAEAPSSNEDEITRKVLGPDDWKHEGDTKSLQIRSHEEKTKFVGDRSRRNTDVPEETENIREINESLIGKDTMDKSVVVSESERKVSVATKSNRRINEDSSTEDYDVVCTDAENNQVVLKVVTTREPTIARVLENNEHFSRKLKKPTVKKRATKLSAPSSGSLATEHTYVNVFTGTDDKVPIYENFRPIAQKSDKVETRKGAKLPNEKSSRVAETKAQTCQSADTSVTGETANLDKTRNCIEEKATETRAVSASNGDKKLRVNKKIATNCLGNTRIRASKVTKNTSLSKRSGLMKSDVSSNETDRRLNATSYDEKLEPSSSSGAREHSSTLSPKIRNETRKKPIEVVYQTAVYNMKNEKLSKPSKDSKESSKGPRYINDLICGAKTKSKTRSTESKCKSNVCGTSQQSPHKKDASQAVRHWK